MSTSFSVTGMSAADAEPEAAKRHAGRDAHRNEIATRRFVLVVIRFVLLLFVTHDASCYFFTSRRIFPPLPSVSTYSAPSGPSLTPRIRAFELRQQPLLGDDAVAIEDEAHERTSDERRTRTDRPATPGNSVPV